MRRAIVICATLLFIVLGLFAALLPRVLSIAAVTVLQRAGFDTVTFDLAYPGLNSAIIRDLRFASDTEGVRAEGTLASAAISYDVLELSGGNARELELTDGTLLLQSKPSEARSAQPIAYVDMLDRVPFDSVILSRLLFDFHGGKSALVESARLQIAETASLNAVISTMGISVTLDATLDRASGDLRANAMIRISDMDLVRLEAKSALRAPPPLIATFSAHRFSEPIATGRLEMLETGPVLELHSVPLEMETVTSLVRTLNGGSAFPVQLSQGNVVVDYRREFGASSSDRGTARVQGLAVKGPALEMHGITGAAAFQTTGEVVVERANLEVGTIVLPVSGSAGSVSFDYRAKNLRIKSAGVGAFGGRITSDEFTIPLANDRWQIPLSFIGVQLAELLAFHPQEHVRGSGELTGKLVLVKTEQGYRIDGGRLDASPPGGTIEVLSADTLRASSPSLASVTDVLRDFRYDTLGADVSLGTNGTLVLAVSLFGRNVNWQLGRDVSLNVNLEENIFELLRTIQLSKGGGEELNKALRPDAKSTVSPSGMPVRLKADRSESGISR